MASVRTPAQIFHSFVERNAVFALEGHWIDLLRTYYPIVREYLSMLPGIKCQGEEVGWLGGLDSNQDNQIQSLMSYRLNDLPAEGGKKSAPCVTRRATTNLIRKGEMVNRRKVVSFQLSAFSERSSGTKPPLEKLKGLTSAHLRRPGHELQRTASIFRGYGNRRASWPVERYNSS